MIRSRVFVALAVALFLAGSTCAEAAAAENSKDKAEADVKALQALTKQVFGTAEKKFNNAEGVKSTVESQKTKADNAESDARAAAQRITATERKAQANAVVQKATEELVKCNTLYQDAKVKANQASNSLKALLTSARDLNNKAQNELQAALSKPADYAKVIQDAETAKTQTTKLSGEIQKSALLSTPNAALWILQAGAKKVQVFKYEAESLVIVSNIETKMSEAETDIQSIRLKKKEIDAIVAEINTKFKSAPDSLSSVLSSLCSTADSQLQTAAKKLTKAQKCNDKMLNRKTQLDKDFETLKARTNDDNKAGGDARTVKWHEEFFDGEIAKIKAALGAAETSLSNAKSV